MNLGRGEGKEDFLFLRRIQKRNETNKFLNVYSTPEVKPTTFHD